MNVTVTPLAPPGRTILHQDVRVVRFYLGSHQVLQLESSRGGLALLIDLATADQVVIDTAGGIE